MNPNNTTIMLLCSIVLLLITFFVFLDSAAIPDLKKKEGVLRSLEQQFAGRPSVEPGARPAGKRTDDTEPPPSEKQPEPTGGFPERVSAIVSMFEKMGLQQKKAANRLVAVIPEASVFHPGDDQIKAEFLSTLSRLTDDAKRAGVDLEIRSIVSSLPLPREQAFAGLKLAAAEAASLYRFFLDSGMPSERLSASGSTEIRQSPEGRPVLAPEKNRVELRFTNRETPKTSDKK